MVHLPEKKIFWLAQDIVPASSSMLSDTSVSSDVPETTWDQRTSAQQHPDMSLMLWQKRPQVHVCCLCSWPPHDHQARSYRFPFLPGRWLLLFLILMYPEPVAQSLVPSTSTVACARITSHACKRFSHPSGMFTIFPARGIPDPSSPAVPHEVFIQSIAPACM